MSWLDNYSTTNTFRSMYINGFIDISGGRLQTRSVTDGHLFIAGDTSLNGNLYVGGDISWNPNNLANDSIPSSAIIGGVVGATGPAGDNGFNANTDIMLLDGVSGNTNAYGLTEINYNMSSSMDMLADPYVKRFTFYASPYNWRGICLLFKPGIYNVTVMFTEKTVSRYYFQFDLDNNHTLGGEPATQYDTNTVANENIIFSRSYIVPHVANFYILEFQSSTVGDWVDNYPQIKFERIGNAEPSGTDDTLSIISGATLTDTKLIEGGIYWNSSTSNPPASGYEPSNHTSQGGTNEWAVVEQAANNSQQVLAWVHRINTNSISSVEGATGATGAVGATGPAGDNGINANTDMILLDAIAPSTNTNNWNLTELDWKISGTSDMLASPYVFKSRTSSNSYKAITMLLKAGVYEVTLSFQPNAIGGYSIGLDTDQNGLTGYSTNEPLAYQQTGNNSTVTITRVFTCTCATNFNIQAQGPSTVYTEDSKLPQIVLKRIAHVEPSGTDDTLSQLNGWILLDTKTIEGGVVWSSTVSNPPPTGYEPSNHTSQGGTNEWAVVEQAANNSQQVLAWVHRINTNSTSSVEVASFHSDADLSLNKRLFVGEDVTLNKRLFVGEDVSLNGNLYVDGVLDMNNNNILNCTNINTLAINGLAPATVNTRFIIGNLAYSAYNSFLSLGDLFGETGQALQKNIPANIGDPNFVWTEERTFYWCNDPNYRVMLCRGASVSILGTVLTPGIWKIKFNIGEIQVDTTDTFSINFFIDNNNSSQYNDTGGGERVQQQKARYVSVEGAGSNHTVPQIDFTLYVGAPGIPSGGEVNSGYAKIMGISTASIFKPLTGYGSWSIECEQLQAFTWNGLYNGFTPPAGRTPYGAGSNFSTAGTWTIAVCN